MEPVEPSGQEHSFDEVKERLEHFNKIQAALSELVGQQEGAEAAQVFHIGQEGQIISNDILRLFEGRRMLDTTTARKGDVLWWKSKSGTTGYFLVSQERTPITSAQGAMRMIKEDGTVKREYPEAYLQGGGFGMLKMGFVVENMPLWFKIPSPLKHEDISTEDFDALPESEQAQYFPKELHTNSVVEMGLIKNDVLPDK